MQSSFGYFHKFLSQNTFLKIFDTLNQFCFLNSPLNIHNLGFSSSWRFGYLTTCVSDCTNLKKKEFRDDCLSIKLPRSHQGCKTMPQYASNAYLTNISMVLMLHKTYRLDLPSVRNTPSTRGHTLHTLHVTLKALPTWPFAGKGSMCNELHHGLTCSLWSALGKSNHFIPPDQILPCHLHSTFLKLGHVDFFWILGTIMCGSDRDR